MHAPASETGTVAKRDMHWAVDQQQRPRWRWSALCLGCHDQAAKASTTRLPPSFRKLAAITDLQGRKLMSPHAFRCRIYLTCLTCLFVQRRKGQTGTPEADDLRQIVGFPSAQAPSLLTAHQRLGVLPGQGHRHLPPHRCTPLGGLAPDQAIHTLAPSSKGARFILMDCVRNLSMPRASQTQLAEICLIEGLGTMRQAGSGMVRQ